MTFTGSSFYDTLNKMLIGFLILLPWIPWNVESYGISKEYSLMFILVGSWLVGIFFWGIMNRQKCKREPTRDKDVPALFEKCFHKFLVKIFASNNPELIKIAYDEAHKYHSNCHSLKNLTDPKKIKDDYFDAYYNVQKHGLLGNVPILESFSEFFKNFFLILIYWILLIIVELIYCSDQANDVVSKFCAKIKMIDLIQTLGLCPYSVIIILGVLVIVCCFFRCKTEVLIHKNIFYANQYLLHAAK